MKGCVLDMYAGLRSIRRERAALERDRVILSAMMEDAKVADAFYNLDKDAFFEGVKDEDLDDLISRIPESDEDEDELDRILASGEGLRVDDILGIDDSEDTATMPEDIEI